MTQLLTLSRAAQLIGVSRHVLQRQIRDGELVSQDGMIASEELLRGYPDLRIEDSGVFEPTTPLAGFTTAKCGRERIAEPHRSRGGSGSRRATSWPTSAGTWLATMI